MKKPVSSSGDPSSDSSSSSHSEASSPEPLPTGKSGRHSAGNRNRTSATRKPKRRPGHGAVAIIVEDAKFLVIRRSARVRAPNLLCFAGGTIEKGETPQQAIERELLEELNLASKPVQHVWQSRTGWGTLLEWVLVERTTSAEPVANPDEVAEWMWLSGDELLNHPKLLPSVPAFYKAWAAREFQLPDRAGAPNPSWAEL